ncbi:hypothetical protein RirG_017010 [Rhizophagus irregularis DAOM 197198w]|uniref:Uncharacterized protein n=1 Tax=Rhizophagus irregularis (strain DAOM 197198w) TaxID=1432141 RepID=A0A015LZS6_RHIIW|nr:hypothetical protein RirG_017010 [Rhizophagus irregularis DAOM 197198w]
MKDVSRVMSASSTQSPQTKIYLAKNSGGIQKRAFVPTVPNPFKFYTETRANNSCNKENSKSPFIPLALSVQQFLENPTRFDAKVSDDNTFQKSTS